MQKNKIKADWQPNMVANFKYTTLKPYEWEAVFYEGYCWALCPAQYAT